MQNARHLAQQPALNVHHPRLSSAVTRGDVGPKLRSSQADSMNSVSPYAARQNPDVIKLLTAPGEPSLGPVLGVSPIGSPQTLVLALRHPSSAPEACSSQQLFMWCFCSSLYF